MQVTITKIGSLSVYLELDLLDSILILLGKHQALSSMYYQSWSQLKKKKIKESGY